MFALYVFSELVFEKLYKIKNLFHNFLNEFPVSKHKSQMFQISTFLPVGRRLGVLRKKAMLSGLC